MQHIVMKHVGVAALLLALVMPSVSAAQNTQSEDLARSVAYIADHGISVVQSSDGGVLLILQTDFDRSINADLRVILGKDGMFTPEADLGPLAQISGLQVFKAAPTVDVSRFDEVHVWDRRSNSVVGIAPLK